MKPTKAIKAITKPCPTCGNLPDIADIEYNTHYIIACNECYEPGYPLGHGSTPALAVTAWCEAVEVWWDAVEAWNDEQ